MADTLSQRRNFAARVSGLLKKSGFNPLPSESSRLREGLRVKAISASECRVVVDLDSERATDEWLADAAEVLRDGGYEVGLSGELALHVWKAAR